MHFNHPRRYTVINHHASGLVWMEIRASCSQTGLEFTKQSQLTSDSRHVSCLSLPSVKVTGLSHRTPVLFVMIQFTFL